MNVLIKLFFYKIILLLGFIFSGCSMGTYLGEQAIGQMKLQWKGRKNHAVLDDPQVSKEIKRKIRLIEMYKKYFFEFFDRKPTSIYSKTTMLETKAVSYLVIASQHKKIQAEEFQFPLMGKFPYIGFFQKKSADQFAKNLRKEKKLVTYIRPVYAFSTLGYFEDRILSSFFEYNDIELASLIFHELFHTIFFIKNEIDVNENLAQFFSRELLKEYFNNDKRLQHFFEIAEKKEFLARRIVQLITELKWSLEKQNLTNEQADEIIRKFSNSKMREDLKKFCQSIELPLNDCHQTTEWNQASMAAYLTYEEKQNFFEDLMKIKKLDLKSYLAWLSSSYEKFQDEKKSSFVSYLQKEREVLNAPIIAD